MMSPITIVLFAFVTMLFACQEPTKTSEQVPSSIAKIDTLPAVFGDTLPIDRSSGYLTGHFMPDTSSLFTNVDISYADREGMYLRKDTYRAFQKMATAAARDSVKLVIRSATRNFDYQKGIWERKWNGETKLSGNISADTIPDKKQRALAILRYSSMPGTSRHHWGTDIDLNAFNNAYFDEGEGLRVYQWLLRHAADYGFCQPYTEKGPHRPSGYEEEKWHWSYLPVSHILLTEASKRLNNSMISGFKGSETAGDIDVVQNYILGVDSSCIHPGQLSN